MCVGGRRPCRPGPPQGGPPSPLQDGAELAGPTQPARALRAPRGDGDPQRPSRAPGTALGRWHVEGALRCGTSCPWRPTAFALLPRTWWAVPHTRDEDTLFSVLLFNKHFLGRCGGPGWEDSGELGGPSSEACPLRLAKRSLPLVCPPGPGYTVAAARRTGGCPPGSSQPPSDAVSTQTSLEAGSSLGVLEPRGRWAHARPPQECPMSPQSLPSCGTQGLCPRLCLPSSGGGTGRGPWASPGGPAPQPPPPADPCSLPHLLAHPLPDAGGEA